MKIIYENMSEESVSVRGGFNLENEDEDDEDEEDEEDFEDGQYYGENVFENENGYVDGSILVNAIKMIKDEIINEENFAKLPKVLLEKFERAKSYFFRGCKFRKTIYSNFSEGIVQTSLKKFNAERRIE